MSVWNTKRTLASSNKTSFLLLLSTCGTAEEARKIARTLVDERLAACVNITKIHSIYQWKDQIEEREEQLLIIKTRSSIYEKAENRIRALHSYELPEIIALKVEKGYAPYLDWIARNVCRLESG